MRTALAILGVLTLTLLAFLLLRTDPAPPPPKTTPGVISEPAGRDSGAVEMTPGVVFPEGLPAAERETLTGVVLTRPDALPLLGATVSFERGGFSLTAVSDSRGCWNLQVPRERPRPSILEVEKDGYLSGAIYAWSTGPSGRVDPVFLEPVLRRVPGRVVDTAGEPVKGACVLMPDPGRIYRSGEDGRFGPVPVGRGETWWSSWSPEHAWTDGEYADGQLLVVLEPAVHAHGILVDGEGRPIEGVDVHRWGGGHALHLSTGGDGKFRWPLAPAETVTLVVRKPGYVLATGCGTVEAFAGGRLRVVMVRAARFAGKVLSADGGPPPPGLTIRADGDADRLAGDGSFDLGPLQPGPQRALVLRPQVPGNRSHPLPFARVRIALAPGEFREGAEIRIPALRVLRAVFRDAATGRPVVGARFLGGTTDAAGVVRVEVPTSVNWPDTIQRPVAIADGFESARIAITRNDETIEAELVPQVPLRLRAVDEAGRPAAGALVRFFGYTGGVWSSVRDDRTGPDGTAWLDLPRCGRGRLEVARACAGRVKMEVEVGEGLDLGDVVLRRGSFREEPTGPEHRILVLDMDGRMLPDAWFAWLRSAREAPDATGAEIRVRGENSTGWVGAPGHEYRMIDLSNGEVTVRLRPSAPARGRLLAAAGRPLRGRYIDLVGQVEKILTDERGAFRIDGFTRGERVRVERELTGYPRIARVVVAGGPETEIRLPARGTIRIGLRGAADDVWPQFRVWESTRLEETFLDDDSTAFFRHVGDAVIIDCPEGTWPLAFRLEPGSWRLWPDVVVKAGRETTLDYDSPTFGRVTGRVLGPGGEPVARVDISVEATGEALGDSKADGTFELWFEESPMVPAGPVRLRFAAWEFAPIITEPVDLRHDVDLEIRLTGRGGRVHGTLVGPDRKPVRGTIRSLSDRGIVLDETVAAADGTFKLNRPLSPGRARLKAEVGGSEPVETTVDVREGETTEVEIVVR